MSFEEEELGTAYAFASGEAVDADHPAVLAKPFYFRPIEGRTTRR
jgi:hypothetical protein